MTGGCMLGGCMLGGCMLGGCMTGGCMLGGCMTGGCTAWSFVNLTGGGASRLASSLEMLAAACADEACPAGVGTTGCLAGKLAATAGVGPCEWAGSGDTWAGGGELVDTGYGSPALF